jgi:hypothetical protein
LSGIAIHIRQKNLKAFLNQSIGCLDFFVFVSCEHFKADVHSHQFWLLLASQEHPVEAFTGHYDSFLVAFLLCVQTFTGETIIDAIKVCDCAPQLGFALV